MDELQDKTLNSQSAIKLFRKGVDAWNAWADEHPGWTVDFTDIDFSPLVSGGEIDFREFQFPGPTLFRQTRFGKQVQFANALFGEGNVDFRNAKFGEGDVFFNNTMFGVGDVFFNNAKFGEGDVDFRNAKFGEGDVFFKNAMFGKGDVKFTSADFGDGDVEFRNAKFGEGDVFFKNAMFGKGDVSFNSADFGVGQVSFFRVNFGGGVVSFKNANFGEGDASFYLADFGECDVRFQSAYFRDGDVDFGSTNFGKYGVSFFRANFGGGDVNFNNADFGDGDVYFDSAKFGSLDLSHTVAHDLSFRGIDVSQTFVLDAAEFYSVPDLRDCKFGHELSMIGTNVGYQTVRAWWLFQKAKGQDAQSKYRVLKRLAMDAKDKTRELMFHAYEQRAKFMHELNLLQYFPIFLYHLLSDFGRSVLRPLLWMSITTLSAALIFFLQSGKTGALYNAFWFSVSNLLPFLTWSRESRITHFRALFDNTSDVSWIVEVTVYTESILSLIFVFLIGLALRNKLRL